MSYYPIDKSRIRTTADGTDRVMLAKSFFMSGYNCSQAVACAYADLFDMDTELMLRLSSSFGGGFGRMREVCGSLSGAGIILGLFSGATDATDSTQKGENYRLVQEAVAAFKEQNGSIICKELLGLTTSERPHTPEARTSEYYKKRPCVELVCISAQITGDILDKYTK